MKVGSYYLLETIPRVYKVVRIKLLGKKIGSEERKGRGKKGRGREEGRKGREWMEKARGREG